MNIFHWVYLVYIKKNVCSLYIWRPYDQKGRSTSTFCPKKISTFPLLQMHLCNRSIGLQHFDSMKKIEQCNVSKQKTCISGYFKVLRMDLLSICREIWLVLWLIIEIQVKRILIKLSILPEKSWNMDFETRWVPISSSLITKSSPLAPSRHVPE
jgi:hypothetical protein